jgi:hypothetical protein
MQWAAAHLIGSDAPLVVRLPFILAFALSTWLMFRLGSVVADQRAGLWAAVALNLSPVFGVTTGTWVLPDGPLDCALLGATLCLLHALPARGTVAVGWWAGAGCCAGLALFSKYTAVLTLLGAGIYLLTSPAHRRWLARPEPYFAALIAGLIFSPVIAWNAANGWASFAFQGQRATGLHLRPYQPFVVIAGEALFLLPWIWLPLILAFVSALCRGPAEWRNWLLCCLGAPPIVLFVVLAVWSGQRVMFHWAAPGYLLLYPLLGAWVAERIEARWLRTALVGTAALILGAVAIIVTQIRLDWLHPIISATAKEDPDLEGIDWVSLRTQLVARGLLAPGAIVGVPNWRDAGKIAYALGPEIVVTVLNQDAREFGLVHPAGDYIGRDVLVLAIDDPWRVERELSPMFNSLHALPAASIEHGHIVQPVTVLIGRIAHAE